MAAEQPLPVESAAVRPNFLPKITKSCLLVCSLSTPPASGSAEPRTRLWSAEAREPLRLLCVWVPACGDGVTRRADLDSALAATFLILDARERAQLPPCCHSQKALGCLHSLPVAAPAPYGVLRPALALCAERSAALFRVGFRSLARSSPPLHAPLRDHEPAQQRRTAHRRQRDCPVSLA